MKFSDLCHEPIPDLAALDRRMALADALGFEGIELTAMHPMPYSPDDLLRLVERHNLPIVSFLTGWSYANEGLCLSSPDGTTRARAVDRLGTYIDLAARVGSILVVGLMQGLRSDEPDEERATDRIAGCLRQVAHRAEDRGVSIAIEPVNHLQVGFHNTAEGASDLAMRVDSPALGYMLDTIHMHIEERSIVETIRRHGGRIGHFHLCETNGGPFGRGALDFAGVLDALDRSGYDRWVSTKVYRNVGPDQAARSSAAYLERIGRWPVG